MDVRVRAVELAGDACTVEVGWVISGVVVKKAFGA